MDIQSVFNDNFQQDWEKLATQAFENYNLLTSDERVWFNIQVLIQNTDNGGLISYYYNCFSYDLPALIQDLKSLNASTILSILEKMNRLFPDGIPSSDFEERNEIVGKWGDYEYSILNKLDEDFYNNQPDLEKKLINHILSKGLSKL